MMRIAVLGGGVSGLSAAYALEKRRRESGDFSYKLFEAAPRLGGVLHTERVEGCVVEGGPDSFLSEKPWAAALCREIGLGDQLISSNDDLRKTYIIVRNRLIEMPDGLMFLVPTKIIPTVLSPLFSFTTKLRMAAEWFYHPRACGDESVASFVKRHYGDEVVDRLADPLLSGVYGGEAEKLSVRSVLPRFVDMETRYGSLGKAMLAARAKMPAANSGGSARGIFTTLKDGMQQIADGLGAQLQPEALAAGCKVRSIARTESGWTIAYESGSQEFSENFDGLVLALPTQRAGEVLGAASPALAAELSAISYSSSITVALGYDAQVRKSLPAGFGFLVPRSEKRSIMAATFVHNKFHDRAPADKALLRCFIGGAVAKASMNLPDDEIACLVRSDLRAILGLQAEPLFVRVVRWPSAMAQYEVGHSERLLRIQQGAQRLPAFALAGNGYSGIGVPDCVRSGSEAAQSVLAALGL